MQTSLQGIAKKAQSQKQYRLRDRYGLLNETLLKEKKISCYVEVEP